MRNILKSIKKFFCKILKLNCEKKVVNIETYEDEIKEDIDWYSLYKAKRLNKLEKKSWAQTKGFTSLKNNF